MQVKDLLIGRRYKIKYRHFNNHGEPVRSEGLSEGEGVLLGIQNVSYYDHTFALDDGTLVWCTSSSIKPLPESIVGIDLGNGDPADPKMAKKISLFLEGLGVSNYVQDNGIVISPRGLQAMNVLLSELYAKALLDD